MDKKKFNINLNMGFSKEKHYCPEDSKCNSYEKEFSRFAIYDGETEVQLLHESYGYCNYCRYKKTARGQFYQIFDTYKLTGNVFKDYPSEEEYRKNKAKRYKMQFKSVESKEESKDKAIKRRTERNNFIE